MREGERVKGARLDLIDSMPGQCVLRGVRWGWGVMEHWGFFIIILFIERVYIVSYRRYDIIHKLQ